MTPGQIKFGTVVALAARKLKLTPRQALAVFGDIAAMMVEYEVSCGRAEQHSATDSAIGLFTDSLLAALNPDKKGLQ